jgi:hypothetical protein
MAEANWQSVRGKCVGGSGDGDYAFCYHILKDGV